LYIIFKRFAAARNAPDSGAENEHLEAAPNTMLDSPDAAFK
jgi:hypothetical protein